MHHKTLSRITAMAMALMLGAALSACSAPQAAPAYRDTSSWPAASSYIANPAAPGGIGLGVAALTYESTFSYIPATGEVIPRLAESWEQDENTDTIHYRKDVKWNDGRPFTAKDIWAYYVLNYTLDVTRELSSLELVDEHTLRFEWRNPVNPDTRLHMIARMADGTVPYHIFGEYADASWELIQQGTPTDQAEQRKAFGLRWDQAVEEGLIANYRAFSMYGPANQIAVGTGAYRVRSRVDRETVMEINPFYYAKEKLGFETAVFTNVDTNTRQSLLQQGVLERVDSIPTPDILKAILDRNSDLVHYKTLDNASVGIALNMENSHLKNVDVRRALVYALDRSLAAKAGNFYGVSSAYAELGMPESFAQKWLDADVLAQMTAYPQNLEKAAQLLTEQGYTREEGKLWKDAGGNEMIFTLGVTPDTIFANAANIAAQQWLNFGIRVDIKTYDAATLAAANKNHENDMACGWISNNWTVYAPYGPLALGYFENDSFAGTAGNFPVHTEGERTGRIDMVYPDYSGEPTDIGLLLGQMPTMGMEEMETAASRISYIANENVFSITLYQNVTGVFLNRSTLTGLPLADQISAENRDIPLQTDPAKRDEVARHAALWAAQGLQLSDGTYQPVK